MLRLSGRLLICVAAFLGTDVGHAQKYPAQPIQVLVANGPGSAGNRDQIASATIKLAGPGNR
jgi:tripartite-type tricarboxylate transporter receptor subunit TctC